MKIRISSAGFETTTFCSASRLSTAVRMSDENSRIRRDVKVFLRWAFIFDIR